MGFQEILILFGLLSLWIWSRLETKRSTAASDTIFERPAR